MCPAGPAFRGPSWRVKNPRLPGGSSLRVAYDDCETLRNARTRSRTGQRRLDNTGQQEEPATRSEDPPDGGGSP